MNKDSEFFSLSLLCIPHALWNLLSFWHLPFIAPVSSARFTLLLLLRRNKAVHAILQFALQRAAPHDHFKSPSSLEFLRAKMSINFTLKKNMGVFLCSTERSPSCKQPDGTNNRGGIVETQSLGWLSHSDLGESPEVPPLCSHPPSAGKCVQECTLLGKPVLELLTPCVFRWWMRLQGEPPTSYHGGPEASILVSSLTKSLWLSALNASVHRAQ